MEYVPILEDESARNASPIETPTEPDGTLLLSGLAAQFPGVIGLRYRNPNDAGGAFRTVRQVGGVLHRPTDLPNWGGGDKTRRIVYTCVYPPSTAPNAASSTSTSSVMNKRRMCDRGDNDGGSDDRAKKRLDDQEAAAASQQRCTDLIVLGLPYNSEEQSLHDYFTNVAGFGPLVMAQVKRNHEGCSKGFGFIRFQDYQSQASCLAVSHHQIDGRRCEVKIPNSQQSSSDGGIGPGQYQSGGSRSRKVFVGRITEELTEQVLQSHFDQRGLPVEEVYIPKPFRSFAFVTFVDAESAAQLIGQDFLINGVSVHIGMANPKQQQHQQQHHYNHQHHQHHQQQQHHQQYPYHHQHQSGSMLANQPYQEVVNSLASNPQLLAAALQQAGMQPQQQQQPTPPPASIPSAGCHQYGNNNNNNNNSNSNNANGNADNNGVSGANANSSYGVAHHQAYDYQQQQQQAAMMDPSAAAVAYQQQQAAAAAAYAYQQQQQWQ